ncbi:glycine zipper domain-containing protein [Imhoffiella purpurea]|uniref:glycine zipper domain-containing protein n=1 Tax=Imhoffiella purpurea TaxID=1249627 RepID=UPI001E3C355A|nr:glycine zipper domain-containing protein [Imhoffiella purpurea]
MQKRVGLAVALVAVTVISSGCSSTGSVQDQAIGTTIGAALGCGVGALITRDARGCAAGAAVGAVVGFGSVVISQYNARQVRSASKDARVYGLSTAPSSPQVKIRKGKSSPRTVRHGDPVNISTDYSLALPKGVSKARVTESWVLKKDGKNVAKLPSKSASRAAGGWVADAEISIPSDVPTGTYLIEHRVQVGSSYDVDESTFVVRS